MCDPVLAAPGLPLKNQTGGRGFDLEDGRGRPRHVGGGYPMFGFCPGNVTQQPATRGGAGK